MSVLLLRGCAFSPAPAYWQSVGTGGLNKLESDGRGTSAGENGFRPLSRGLSSATPPGRLRGQRLVFRAHHPTLVNRRPAPRGVNTERHLLGPPRLDQAGRPKSDHVVCLHMTPTRTRNRRDRRRAPRPRQDDDREESRPRRLSSPRETTAAKPSILSSAKSGSVEAAAI